MQVSWKGHRTTWDAGSNWHVGQPISLPLQAPLTTAAAIADTDSGLRVAAVQASSPGSVEVLQLTGDPTCVSSAGTPLTALCLF